MIPLFRYGAILTPLQGGDRQRGLELKEREEAKKATRKAEAIRTKEPQPQVPLEPQPRVAKKSTCSPLYYDLLLITSRDRMVLLVVALKGGQ